MPAGLLDSCRLWFRTYNYATRIHKETQYVKASRFFLITVFILILSMTACNLPSNQESLNDAVSLTLTAAAETAQAIQLAASPTFTETSVPPTSTSTVGPPTAAPLLPTFTPSGTFFIVDTGANCRVGPGTVYDKVTTFPSGSYLTLVGHNADNSWWYILTGSINCWISASTGHTTGPLGSLPLITAPPTPTAGVGPLLNNPIALLAEVSYPSNCTSNIFQTAIHASDTGNGINSVWLNYRYVGDGGYTGSWHTVSPTDNASGGVYGFNYPIGAEAASELVTQNGTLQYQFFAKDNSGNTSTYPNGSVLGIPIKYCP